ncbi:MAG TPA: alpha/beta hydrolase domain-containing protein [Vicinamibacterales bacterium]|nr:alpha/beta hydrolase domain-containing protein [Vicinamibacterales bacterium]
MMPFVLAAAIVTGPITGGDRGQPFAAMRAADLAAAHYTEEEFFITGTASSYKASGPLAVDGRWTVTPNTTAPFNIRVLVRRPADAKAFNGVVLVEWLNVTALAEGAADFMQMQEEILRAGYAWVGVGAQAAGVNSPRSGLKDWDKARYGSLQHPGDAYAYDIFTQAAQAMKRPNEVMIATGRSQSAFRLVTYINAVHPLTHAFAGYLVHSRGAQASGLSAEGLATDADKAVPPGAHIRTDIDVPILDVQTEGDMVALRAHLTHQDAFPKYRRWEIAGAAHAETPRWIAEAPPALDMGPGCKDPVNSAPHHAVMKAALRALTGWVRTGKTPPQSPAIALGDPAAPDPIERDAHGNAKGGIRLPELEAPTAVLDGGANTGAVEPVAGAPRNFCFLFGRTKLFDDATLKSLYPSHDAFVAQFTRAVDALERDGYLLKPEAAAARDAATASHVAR